MRILATQLVTEDQLCLIYTAWHTTASVPRKGTEEYVCFPDRSLAKINRTEKKSEYGKRLYQITFMCN